MRSPSPPASSAKRILFLRVPVRVSEANVRTIFTYFGSVRAIVKEHVPPGTRLARTYVTMASEHDAKQALDHMQDGEIDGMRVDLALVARVPGDLGRAAEPLGGRGAWGPGRAGHGRFMSPPPPPPHRDMYRGGGGDGYRRDHGRAPRDREYRERPETRGRSRSRSPARPMDRRYGGGPAGRRNRSVSSYASSRSRSRSRSRTPPPRRYR
ncbi:hypothetical protein BCR44DRAFT_1423278 [Catenaria anguillulae PL171]|uniref:RRM domain-containing protein n=1 Tax=Catenaria anguillulae PL171 TaxID=765915 RepID=A0A1Y2I469_9FUNG|nr:hypothetical protein BCR44DRAFT_1423278 [Catenaria anguillulae PL171]